MTAVSPVDPVTSPAQHVPIARPFFGEEEERAVVEVLRSGWVTQGPVVARFEEVVAERVGAAHAVAVTSATTALQATLVALGIGPGDEVVCPSYTYIATPNSIVNAGATPVFADLDAETWSVDPAAVEAAITPRTAAIMPVHMGYAADSAALHDIARRHGLAVVEDAAPALGAHTADDFGNRAVGDSEGAVVFSFHPRKIVTCGEGGVITTPDGRVAEQLRLLRHHHMSVSDVARHRAGGLVFESYEDVGHNWRMTDLQAAVGVAQMGKLDRILAERADIARRYDEVFLGHPHLRRRRLLPGSSDAHQAYSVEVLAGAPLSRDDLMAALQRAGIATRRGVMSSHLEPAYVQRFGRLALPHTERVSGNTLMLPVFAGMRADEVDHVRASVLSALAGPRG